MTGLDTKGTLSHRLSTHTVRDAFTALQKENDIDQNTALPNLRLGVAAYLDGEYEIAERFFLQAHAEALLGNHAEIQGKVLLNWGNTCFARNAFGEALEKYEAAFQIFSELGDKVYAAEAVLRKAEADVQLSHFEKALAGFKESLLTFQSLQLSERAFSTQLKLALLWILLGDFQSARELISDARRKLTKENRLSLDLLGSFVEVKYLQRQARHQDARKILLRALDLSKDLNPRDSLRVQLELLQIETALDLGEVHEADQMLQNPSLRNRTENLLDTNLVYGRLLLRSKRNQGKSSFSKARAILDQTSIKLKDSFSFLELLVEVLEIESDEELFLQAFQIVQALRQNFPLNFEINLLTHPTVLRLHRLQSQSTSS